MATNITTIRKKSNPFQKDVCVFQQATPDDWGDGEPPSPVEFYDSIACFGYPQSINADLKEMKQPDTCPCGGGMSCIVDRRSLGDWVHEDEVFMSGKCSLRKNCLDPMTDAQIKLLKEALRKKE